MRTNFFYVTDSANADINADDNGAYTKMRNTTKLYTIATGKYLLLTEMMLSIITISE